MRGAKSLKYLAVAACTFLGLLLLVPPWSARAQAGCDSKGLSSAYATADLSVTAPSIDDANWKSIVTFTIPISWSMASRLLQSPDSEGFQAAYNCIITTDYIDLSETPIVTLDQGNVVLKLVENGPVYILIEGGQVSWPWISTIEHGDLKVNFLPFGSIPDQGAVPIPWKDITATISGFQVVAPTPIPSSELSAGESVWYSKATKPLKNVSFLLAPNGLLGIALKSQSGGPVYYAPLDLEEFLLSVVLLGCLSWHRQGTLRWRRQDTDSADGIWLTTYRLCILVAALSLADFGTDIAVWRFSSILGSLVEDVQPVIIGAFGLAFAWRHIGTLGKLIAALTFVALVLIAGGLDISPAAGLASATFCWFVILYSINAIFRPAYDKLRRLILCSVLLGVLSLLARPEASPANVFPTYAMPDVAGCLIIFGSIAVIVQTRRPVALLLEKSDRLLLAMIIGYAMLFVAPRWYVGIHISIAVIFAFLVTAAILSVSSRHSLAGLAKEALQRISPDQLQPIQRKLVGAGKRLDEISKDLKSLEGVPLNRTQLRRRSRLEDEAARLRQWPTAEDQDPPTVAKRTGTILRRFLGLQSPDEKPGVRFPESTGPVDMALALGPGCEPWRNVRKSYGPAIGLVFIPAVYFAWQESFPGVQYATLPYLIFNFIINLCNELTLWLLPLLVLTVAWSSLAGRRGPGRAIQVWLCVTLPLVIHSFFNRIFHQSGTLTPILQCSLLLIVLLCLSLWLDLSTLRQYRTDVPPFRLFQGYVRLNRVAAVLTILVPLVTAGLTIWNQIDSGVLQQKVAPTQISGQGPSPTGSPSGSPSPSGTPSPGGSQPNG